MVQLLSRHLGPKTQVRYKGHRDIRDHLESHLEEVLEWGYDARYDYQHYWSAV